jgi:hypothetical protein
MQFRCYICSVKLGKGIPPLEALSSAQAKIVDAKDAPQRFAILEGTEFEGMSSYSFCAFCLTAIRDTPSVFKGGARDKYFDFVQLGRPSMDDDWDGHFAFDWTRASRLQTLYAAKDIYKNYDFSLLESLIDA